jgi:hypothetical protein
MQLKVLENFRADGVEGKKGGTLSAEDAKKMRPETLRDLLEQKLVEGFHESGARKVPVPDESVIAEVASLPADDAPAAVSTGTPALSPENVGTPTNLPPKNVIEPAPVAPSSKPSTSKKRGGR